MYDIWIGLEKGDKASSKVRVFMGQLEGKGGEYEVEVAAVLKISRTEEGCSQEIISKHVLGNGLSNC